MKDFYNSPKNAYNLAMRRSLKKMMDGATEEERARGVREVQTAADRLNSMLRLDI